MHVKSSRIRYRLLAVVMILACATAAAAVDNPVSRIDGLNDSDVLKYNGEYYFSGNWLRGDILS